MDARVGEETMVDIQHRGLMMPEGSRSGGEPSAPEQREPSTPTVGVVPLKGTERPEPEVPAKAQRRRFLEQYKKEILEKAAICKGRPGAMGALLRRESETSENDTETCLTP